MTAPWTPPPYPYDRLDEARTVAADRFGEVIDLSIGTPFDPPPAFIADALAHSGAERGYPPSNGSEEYRQSASDWMARRFGVRVSADHIAACIGSKEFIAGLPQWLRLRDPSRDTILYPAVSYPSYAMGATLAGCRAVPVPVDAAWRLDLDAIDPADRDRALCLWINTPGNPAGGLDDLAAATRWAREHDVLLISDECYIEFTWDDPYPGRTTDELGRSVLEFGGEGVLALHSLSKRSNCAGVRGAFYAGDESLVHYLRELRKHTGHMPPGPIQAAAAAALADDEHVDVQREVYRQRLERAVEMFRAIGIDAVMPGGGFYLWLPAPDGDAWALVHRLAAEAGAIVSPGEFYGDAGAHHVRAALVQPDRSLDLIAERLA